MTTQLLHSLFLLSETKEKIEEVGKTVEIVKNTVQRNEEANSQMHARTS